MKHLILIMAAIVCLATSAMAQITDTQTLPPALWKQGVARCAHYTAYAKGFAKRSDEMQKRFPQGYYLDDLSEVYNNQGQKWEKIYDEFKKADGKSGSIEDLKELVTPQVWKLVEPDFKKFITDHPEAATAAVPAADQPQDEAAEGVQADQDGNNTAEIAPVPGRHRRTQDSSAACPANLPLWLGILGSLLGLCALLTALSNRGKINEMKRSFAREIDRTNANLQEFSTDAADQMKALSIRLTGKEPRPIRKEEPVVVDELVDEAAPVADEPAIIEETVAEEPVEDEAEEKGELMTLFMNKPDENDDFTRVSDTLEPGNSIYVLDTWDGVHGKFEVIDKPEVHRFALMMPAENLIRACSGNAIQIPSGTRIVTDRPGEAEFIDGKWHVVVKAIIHYEG